MAKSTVASAASTNGIFGRTARPPGQLWQVPVFLVGLVALGLVAAATPWTALPQDYSLARDLATIRRALEKPGVPPDHIITLAETAVGLASQQTQRAGEANLLLGAILLRKAERASATDVKDKDRIKQEREKAAMHLGLAELRGVPAEDKARLTYLLGKLAYLNGNNLRAIELLTQALPAGADNPAEGYGLLVELELRRAVPDLDAALAANLSQLKSCDDEKTLTQARMLRGELLLKTGKRQEAIKVLDIIGPKAPLDIRLKARYLQAQAAVEEGLWRQAIGWWNELLNQTSKDVPVSKARIQYNLGICYLNYEPPTHENEAVAAWTAAKAFGGEEAQAAALALGELRLFSGGNPAAALDHFKEALDKVCTPSEYKNSLVDLRKTCQLLEEACRIFDERQDNEHFLQAAELYKKLAGPGVADDLIGHAAEARGREIMKLALQEEKNRKEWLEKARTFFQKAAGAYEKAAEIRTPADSVEAMWRCIECYRLAEDPVRAVAVLTKYVTLPMPDERKAEAWFTLAEIQRSQHHADTSVSYKQVLLYNNDDYTARALLHLAQLALAEQRFTDAEAMLRQVTNPSTTVVERDAHQFALLMLADLYYEQRQFEKSAFECKEILKQYPGNSSHLRVREKLGECYRLLAKQAEEEAKLPNLTATKIQYLEQVRRGHLESALQIYLELAGDLEAKANAGASTRQTLSSAEDALRRKAYFVTADCYFDLNNFEDAFQRYTRLFNDFREAPEGLWASQRIYKCWMHALNPRHELLDAVHETALATVEHCVHHLDEYERAGAFRTAADKANWQRWLEEAYDALRKTGRRG